MLNYWHFVSDVLFFLMAPVAGVVALGLPDHDIEGRSRRQKKFFCEDQLQDIYRFHVRVVPAGHLAMGDL